MDIFGLFWAFFGPFLDLFWTLFEPFLDLFGVFWAISRPFLDFFWTFFGPFLDLFWTFSKSSLPLCNVRPLKALIIYVKAFLFAVLPLEKSRCKKATFPNEDYILIFPPTSWTPTKRFPNEISYLLCKKRNSQRLCKSLLNHHRLYSIFWPFYCL